MGGWGGVRQCGVSKGQVCCLEYQHPDADAKTAQTGETIRREGREEGRVWVTATVAPRRVAWRMRQQRAWRKALASVGGKRRGML